MKIGKKQNEWLEALESGKYKQGSDKLCKIDNNEKYYCCLGVGAIILDDPFEISELKFNGSAYFLESYRKLGLQNSSGNFINESCINSRLTQDELKFFPNRKPGYSIRSLIHLNDDGGATFKEIATFIRVNPGRVFVESK